MQFLNQGIQRGNLLNYENNNDPHFRLSRSNLFGLGDLTKISLYYFGTFANFTDQLRILTNFGFLPRTLAS